MWTPVNLSPVAVAVKTLKSESNENKVQFLREAAIMGQFHHRNVVVMHGVVLTGKPVYAAQVLSPNCYSVCPTVVDGCLGDVAQR